MSKDRELEIQRQFLDEAEDYLSTLEAALLGIADGRIDIPKINAALRAAHSIKGGAGMMGFTTLSHLAHRLEDSFKVLKTQKQSVSLDADLETQLLMAVDCLRQVIQGDRTRSPIDTIWLQTQVEPVFDLLHERLGDPQAEDANSVLSPEEGQDILPLLFQTEVEGCLQRLEAVLANPEKPCLKEEVAILTQELGGLGEMLALDAFSQFCDSVAHHLAALPDQVEMVAQMALQGWRRSQALILTGNLDLLPTQLEELEIHHSEIHLPALSVEASEPEVTPDALETLAPAVWSITPTPTPIQPNKLDTRASKVTDFRVLDATVNSSPSIDESSENTVRVPLKQLNQLNDLFGELTIGRNALELHLKRLQNLVKLMSQRVQTLDQSNAQLRTAYDVQAVQNVSYPSVLTNSILDNQSSFDALEMDRYSSLHLLSQQVMETIVQIREVNSDLELGIEDTDQTLRDLNKTTRQLRKGLTQLRMRPLSDVVDRFPRALRELSLRHGKPAELKIYGGATLIDRNVLEALSDPLMHLLRNAYDHGIEAPDIRRSRGKPEQGLIEIRAAHRGNRTLITIRDDGGGIPLDKIRDRAKQMGLDETLLENASDEDLLSLIFEPGFSTTDTVTDLSGRGVGMDVVRDHLRKVRGEIKVNTEAGIGTTFTLSVPFTLTVVRILLIESNGMLLAFPTDAIGEMLMLHPEQILTTAGSEAFRWEGIMVPLIRLHQWLTFHQAHQVEDMETPPTVNHPTVLMISLNEQIAGVQVERCWGEQEVAIRPVEGNLPLPLGFSNCTILGDGRVVPLVNVAELLQWILKSQTVPPTPRTSQPFTDLYLAPTRKSTALAEHLPTPPSLPASKPSLLIVDDSINVRRFLALTLERAGYRVEQAKDGQEALEKLMAGLTVRAIVCDIEMPRLDGYGLLAQLKSNPALEHLPVAMLTSRSGDKHRQLALSLGATAYFSKPYNEQTLLRTLEQMVGFTVPV